MEPYVIRQGDYLLKIAHQFGFDADTVWHDPSNADLRQLRPNPNILLAGDLLQIPDQDQPPVAHTLAPGSTNAFAAPDPPAGSISHQFVGADATVYANKAYTIQELDQLTGLQTNADGVAEFQVPVTLETATLVFTDTGESWALHVGYLDPINSPIGIFERLQNLGYIPIDVQFDTGSLANNLPGLRYALQALKAAQGDGVAPTASTPATSQGDPSASDAEATPPSPDPGSTAGPASATDASPSDAGATPPSAGDSPAPAADATADNAGLADDGTLDADTSGLLLKVYGC